MRRGLSVIVAVFVIAVLAGVALAGPPFGPGAMMGGGWGMGPGAGMGPGWHMGGGWRMGGGPGAGACPGATAAPEAQGITEDRAKELATEYAGKYLKGYTVERVLPFAGRFHTMYQVELKGPSGETRILHVNPWGDVMPFGGRWQG